MDTDQHDELIKNIEAVRNLLSQFSTVEVVGFVARHNSDHAQTLLREGVNSQALSSPARQLSYLLGLLMTSEEPEHPKECEQSDWNQIQEYLNSIYTAYAGMFLHDDKTAKSSQKWTKERLVAMSTFLNYFHSGMLATVEQLVNRIDRYLAPFDVELKERFGVSATEASRISMWITETQQELMDETVRDVMQLRNLQDKLGNHEGSLEGVKHEAAPIADRLQQALGHLWKPDLRALKEKYGQVGESFVEVLSAGRITNPDYTYPTEQSVVDERPLIKISEDTVMIQSANSLFIGILNRFEGGLLSSESRENYLRIRGSTLEAEVEGSMRRIFGEDARFLSRCYETPDLEHEHDLIVIWKRTLLVIEAKSSPPKEPFRDPEKGFVRIRDAFRGETGIQGAFEQTAKILRRLSGGECVPLYDKDRNEIVVLDPEDYDEVYGVCVTRDNFGLLATDLALMLEKGNDDQYPWAVNLLDLETIADAWEYFGWSQEELFKYLRDRVELHGRVYAPDELEITGCFIAHGSLAFLTDKRKVFIPPHFSSIFDRIYYAKIGGPAVTYAPVEPVLREMSIEGRKGYVVTAVTEQD